MQTKLHDPIVMASGPRELLTNLNSEPIVRMDTGAPMVSIIFKTSSSLFETARSYSTMKEFDWDSEVAMRATVGAASQRTMYPYPST